MNTKEIETGVLRDMIQINDKRRYRYNNAIEELDSEDEDLKTVFAGMAQQSANYASDLMRELEALKEDKNDLTEGREQRQHSIDTEIPFSGHNRQTILNNCELGEVTVQKAYARALSTEGLSLPVESILESQQMELRAAHNHIEELKNSVA